MVAFEVTEDSVRVLLGAITDAPTVVNLTSHAYFNLDGDGSPVPWTTSCSACGRRSTCPWTPKGIPAGPRHRSLARPSTCGAGPTQGRGRGTGGFDHNFTLDGLRRRLAADAGLPGDPHPAGAVHRPARVAGLHRRWLRRLPALDHRGGPTDGATGLALEPQLFPDTPNRPEFGSAVLRPGDAYYARIEWRFVANEESDED